MTAAPDERSTPLMSTTHADYRLSQLDELEAESIHIFREVAAEFEKPVLMFSGGKASRNRLQIGTLLNVIEEEGFTAAFGGGRRDEEKARAKERVYSHRDDFGQWDPKNQRPELWSLYNGRIHGGEHMRIFP